MQRCFDEQHHHCHQQSTSTMLQQKRGVKRKASGEQCLSDRLFGLADIIEQDLATVVPGDPIEECGPSCLSISDSRPEDVLELAHQKLHAWPYRDVPVCWRRMYEDASLQSAVKILRTKAESMGMRFEPEDETEDPTWLTEVVTSLDMALQLTGAPGRAQVFERVFKELSALASHHSSTTLPPHFSIPPPNELDTRRPIARHLAALDFEEFQAHLDNKNSPTIIKGALQHWPACTKWSSPSYWSNITLGGKRLVPVEVGAQYTEEGWSQRIMPFREFLTTYLLAESGDTGYLAQYDLFAQIPALSSDVQIPDYCYCSPPQTKSTTATNGAEDITTEVNDPLMNLWLGPAGTKTPLHTDPYSNILAQVMGYKYVRLYAPTETAKLCPMGTDDKGVDMSNTSSVDVSLSRSQQQTDVETEKINRQRDLFPLFQKAEFVEGILGPGECLYIPQGWWHYIEGLTIGASVSFWWN